MSAQEVAQSVHDMDAHEALIAKLLQGKPFYIDANTPCAPHLPVGSPERETLFSELGKTFAEDWAAAEHAVEEERRRSAGDLYFVTAGNAVKIGRTANMKARLRFIQGHNHEKVEVAVLREGEGWREKEYHRRFAAQRLRGEWFALTPEIELEIELLK